MTTNLTRTHVRVTRSDGTQYPSVAFAFRTLLGTPNALGAGEHSRMRPILRNGGTFIDAHGFTWSSVGGTVAEESIRWTDFTFGVEIECVAPIDQYALRQRLVTAGFANWSVVSDGSVNADVGFHPMEVVSPILQGEVGLASLTAVMDLLRIQIGCRVNNSCGMHVHIGVRGMKPARLRKIAIAFVNNEQNFDSLVPAARNTNRYCQSILRNYRNSGSAALLRAETVSALGSCLNGGNSSNHYNHFRYYKLNFQSFVRHGTIEFRQHGGSVESKKACAWVRLIAGFCAHAASEAQQTPAIPQTFAAFLSGATAGSPETAEYLEARRVKFASQNR